MATISVLLASEGTGVLFRHTRIGRNGRTFECLKFRTMVDEADRALLETLEAPERRAEWEGNRKLRSDPRVTPLGRVLRRWSLDELPQLWNVLRGDMSLVGPRPVVREETSRYGRRLSQYLATKPGITGLWQVMGRSTTSYRRRVALDVYYCGKRSLLLDLYILVKTPFAVLRGSGSW
jgi:lipopolysaccharide/colanic/teichoic acid biosynthesis glycosyltransferase